MTDVTGNPEEERTSDFYNQPWAEEAVHRYFYRQVSRVHCTKNKFFIKDFFCKFDQIPSKLRISSHLLKKSLM